MPDAVHIMPNARSGGKWHSALLALVSGRPGPPAPMKHCAELVNLLASQRSGHRRPRTCDLPSILRCVSAAYLVVATRHSKSDGSVVTGRDSASCITPLQSQPRGRYRPCSGHPR